MIVLSTVNHSIEFTTSSSSTTSFYASFVDLTSTTTESNCNSGSVSSATTTTLLSAPGASTQRLVKGVTISNTGSAAQTVTVNINVSGTLFRQIRAVLQSNESLAYDESGWKVYDPTGSVRLIEAGSASVGGFPANYRKTGTASESAGRYYCFAKDAGFPGAWSPGTPGVTGRATDGTALADAGCLVLQSPDSGNNYLVGLTGLLNVAHMLSVIDILWINTGLTVTLTTSQSVASVTLPARDLNGDTLGLGVQAAVLVTAATTNAATVTATMIYTSADGVGSRTATAVIAATAVVGTFIPFALAAGDRGVRSIESITLSASLTTGSISLVMYREIASVPCLTANIPYAAALGKGVKLFNGSCLHPVYYSSTTTATSVHLTAQFEQK